MRPIACLPLVLLLLLPALACAEDAPVPRVDGVDHADPAAHVALGSDVGAHKRTEGIARQLSAKGKTPRGTLSQIVRWVGRNLRTDPAKTGTWRTLDQILVDGSVGGDGDRAYVIGVLARAAAIPTVWVKSLSAAWLRDVKLGTARLGEVPLRVFLEVHLEGGWRLVDTVSARIYDTYDPRQRLLPDGFLAYDKGSNPYALVLPNRGALFTAQTRAYVGSFDLRRIPWSTSNDLLAAWRVAVTGLGGPATYARAAARTLGFLVGKTFDSAWDRHLAAARGSTLIVTSNGREPNLPAKYREAWLGTGWQQHFAGAAANTKGWVRRVLPDGTRVILVLAQDYGPVELAVAEALDG